MAVTYQIKLVGGDALTYEADNVEVTATSVTGIKDGIVQWVTPLSQVLSINRV